MHTGASVWPARWNNEYVRMLVGCIVAVLNVSIIAQDWSFPDFSDDDEIKIVALELTSINLDVRRLFSARCLERFAALARRLPVVYVSGKWVNYMGIIMGVMFDWGYWYMTALCFRPCDYAQLWDSNTGWMYTMTAIALQNEHAGGPAANNCSFFTDHAMQRLYFDRANASAGAPLVARVRTGVFTGAYTIDEHDEYVWDTAGSALMNLMVVIPVAGYAVFFWLIAVHEKVHCFNARDVFAFVQQRKNRLGDGVVDGAERMHAVFHRLESEMAEFQRRVASRPAWARCFCCRSLATPAERPPTNRVVPE